METISWNVPIQTSELSWMKFAGDRHATLTFLYFEMAIDPRPLGEVADLSYNKLN
ncbi:hypothetical protein ACE1B6_04310 [Aerosakkonemataceae cyanobacterium BLCC-F154]|uniref:Uncharacterized protein n=1 Tax=Floridaenema fluviatile BLCC-F154 TaxID=3153640 RepID=A0ABV4Y6P1_9CYAN